MSANIIKTLLFLCIFIKKATATLSYANPRSTFVDLGTKTTFDNEVLVTFECPIDDLIQIKPQFFEKADSPEFIALKNKTIDTVQVRWLKNRKPIHRENGNPIRDSNNGGFRDLTLLGVTPGDQGEYTCKLNYSNVPINASAYYDLYPGAKFQLKIDKDMNRRPDKGPTVSHAPKDLIVKRGENALFTCKAEATYASQSKYWFKSCDLVYIQSMNSSDCMKKFQYCLEEVEKEPRAVLDIMAPYIIPAETGDTIRIYNASDYDIATYGCGVFNVRGHDIRLANLTLFDRFIQSEIGFIPTQSTDSPNQTLTTTTTLQPNTINQTPFYNSSSTVSTNDSMNLTVAETTEQLTNTIVTRVLWIVGGFAALMLFSFTCIVNLFVSKKKQKVSQNNIEPLVGNNSSSESRQHLPSVNVSPNIYNISTTDGFISGHLHQSSGHLMTQSICDEILEKEKNPSISSNTNSDEASWGKSLSSHSDNCRTFYLHTSNTTATTAPMYDHPPSSSLLCSAVVRNACVSNPLYGYLQLDSDESKWAFPRRNLERLNKIGEGQFGEVWRYIARQKDGKENLVAVKQLKNRAGLGDRERLELIAEIEIMKSLSNHPNVIKLLGYCADGCEPILLMMEFAENGKLQTFLRDCRSVKKFYTHGISDPSPSITSKELIKFSYHIAKGMDYIASQGIIHRDLASRNILISKDKVCKVADFGFARRVTDDCAYERTTTSPVPVKWMAPEALVENKFTSKSDVFSLGILMWEIVTLGATPYEYLSSEEVYRKVTAGGRLERPVHCKDEFFTIMSNCWLQDPTKRPTFKELAFQLEGLLLSETDYIELDMYPEHAYYNILNTAEKEVVRITPPP